VVVVAAGRCLGKENGGMGEYVVVVVVIIVVVVKEICLGESGSTVKGAFGVGEVGFGGEAEGRG
jgi:hypothetical protein